MLRRARRLFSEQRAPVAGSLMMMPPAAFVFDAYGTLFDVHSVAALAEELAPRHGAALARFWRTKQREYTWLQSLMPTSSFRREGLAALTSHALAYASSALILPLDGSARNRLL